MLQVTPKQITSNEAKGYLELVNHEKQKRLQRKLRTDHISFLASEMRRGEFTGSNIHLVKCQEDGLTYLVNGQHSLHAVIRYASPVRAILEEEEVETYKEVALLYRTHDRALIRNMRDTLRAYETEEAFKLSFAEQGYIIAAIKYILARFDKEEARRFNDGTLISATELYIEAFKKLKMCIAGGERAINKKLMSRAYLAIALLTIRYQPEVSEKFWRQVSHGDKLSRIDPAWRLREVMKDHRIQGGDLRKTGKETKARYLTRAASICWNHFFEGSTLRQLQLRNGLVELKGVKLAKAQKELERILLLDDSDTAPHGQTDFSKIKGNDFYYEYEGTRLERVTTFVKKLHPPFNKDEVAQKVARSTNRPVEQIKMDWELKGKHGRELGEKVHQYIQERLSGEVIDGLRYRLNGSTPKEFDSFDSFWNNAVNELTPTRIEWIVGDIGYKLGGRVDVLFHHPTDGYILADFKTGRIEEWDRDKFYPPFDDIPNDTLYHYSFQLSLYKIIIERNTNIKVAKMWIVHLKPDGGFEIIPAEDYSYRLKSYLLTP